MRASKIVLAFTVVVLTAIGVSAADIVLTRGGDLYRLAQTEEGLVVSVMPADANEGFEWLVPQTTGVITSYRNIAVDESTGNLYLVWQQGEAPAAELRVASLVDDTWDGPVTLAGGDGTNAVYPQLLRYTHTFEYQIGEGEDVETVSEDVTFLHIVWWNFSADVADGAAYLGTVELDATGLPSFPDFQAIQLSGLLPFGIGCSGIDDAPDLAQPKIWIDPQSGLPIVMATDFDQCLFELLQLRYEVVETQAFVPSAKRRRRHVGFGRTRIVPFSKMPALAKVKVDPARDMGVTLYWLEEKGIEFLTLEDFGWSDLKWLPVGEHLNQTEAVELIRTLAR